ncbi:MAG: hypothetical protein ABIR70_01820 [Bryobacteraceae bacterium]
MLRLLLLLLVCSGTAFSQIDALRAEIRAAYADGDLLRARDFFESVKEKPNVADYVEALRAELDDRGNSARMRVDASVRLLILSPQPSDYALAARVLARANFREVAIASYYAALKRLANVNVNISLAAFKLLEKPDVQLRWEGEFVFDQPAIVASLLLPTDQKYWADSAIERLPVEEDEMAQQTLLNLLWFAQTDFADVELEAFAKDPSKPSATRALAAGFRAQEPDLSSLDRVEVLANSEEQLREQRRQHQAAGIYFKNIMPTMQKDTMKILLKRRLAAADGPH